MTTALEIPRTIPITRWGGAAFMFGNVFFVLNKVDEMSRLFLSRPMPDIISGQTPTLIMIGQLALIIGYLAFYRHLAPRADRPARLALRIFSWGGILLAISHIGFIRGLSRLIPPGAAATVENLFLGVILGLLMLIVGLLWLGAINLRTPILRRWRWLPLATGVMGFIGFFLFSGEQITAIFLLFRTLFALGLIGLGLVLFLDRPGGLAPKPILPAGYSR